MFEIRVHSRNRVTDPALMRSGAAFFAALSYFSSAVDVNAENLCGVSRGKEGIRACDLELSQNPSNHTALAHRAIAHQEDGQLVRALADFDSVVAQDAKNLSAILGRSRVLRDLGRSQAAVRDLDALLEKNDPEVELTRDGIEVAHYNRGLALHSIGRNKLAARDFQSALRINPKSPDINFALGVARFSDKAFIEAAASFEIAAEVSQDSYADLLLYLSRSRANSDATKTLSLRINSTHTKAWPFPLIQLFAGELSIARSRSKAIGKDQACEWHFYFGQFQLLKKNMVTAKAEFRKAIDQCPPTHFERAMAISELSIP